MKATQSKKRINPTMSMKDVDAMYERMVDNEQMDEKVASSEEHTSEADTDKSNVEDTVVAHVRKKKKLLRKRKRPLKRSANGNVTITTTSTTGDGVSKESSPTKSRSSENATPSGDNNKVNKIAESEEKETSDTLDRVKQEAVTMNQPVIADQQVPSAAALLIQRAEKVNTIPGPPSNFDLSDKGSGILGQPTNLDLPDKNLAVRGMSSSNYEISDKNSIVRGLPPSNYDISEKSPVGRSLQSSNYDFSDKSANVRGAAHNFELPEKCSAVRKPPQMNFEKDASLPRPPSNFEHSGESSHDEDDSDIVGVVAGGEGASTVTSELGKFINIFYFSNVCYII